MRFFHPNQIKAKKILSLFALVRMLIVLFISFATFTSLYFQKKIISFSHFFEKQKNLLVRFFMMKRGRYNRPFLHIATMSVLGVGVVVAPFVAESYPIFSQNTNSVLAMAQTESLQSISVDSDVFKTEISQKPRDKVIAYTVEGGDTLSTIAQKFGVSMDTIRWANNLTSDSLTVGDELKIPPVTGIVHKVAKGDTVYSIAKVYDTNPQAIVDFPFNEFANPQTFSLVEGQMLIVPDGIKPAEKPKYLGPRYIATGPVNITASGFTWPVQGILSQLYSWYHKGIDIATALGTPVVAAENGRVSEVYTSGYNGGYGTHAYIQGASGNTTLYAHMSGVNVSPGDTVTAGKSVIGWVGLTGRTTGPHLHFEIRGGGGFLNPLSVLR